MSTGDLGAPDEGALASFFLEQALQASGGEELLFPCGTWLCCRAVLRGNAPPCQGCHAPHQRAISLHTHNFVKDEAQPMYANVSLREPLMRQAMRPQ